MKIGLLTFHSAHNYGAVLQALAMQNTIENLGHELVVIDYRPKYIEQQSLFSKMNSKSILNIAKIFLEELIILFWKKRRSRRFNKFIINRLNLSSNRYNKVSDFSLEDFDAVIYGSDQIWNIKLTHGFDEIYWGAIDCQRDIKRISYAASMTNYNLTKNQLQTASAYLNNFNSISVREDELHTFLKQRLKIQSTKVLDPTFLLNRAQWERIEKGMDISGKYVLLYSVGLRDEVIKVGKQIAKQLNVNVIELTRRVNKDVIFNKYQTVSPEMFIALFNKAECVVTSSFHGTTFSLIFNKAFYSILHNNDKDSRQKTILSSLGLSNRMIERDSIPTYEKIEYDEINDKLEKLCADSIDFLKMSLND